MGKRRATPINDINDKASEGSINESMIEVGKKKAQWIRVERITNDIVRRYQREGYDSEQWRGAIAKAVQSVPTEARIYEIYEASHWPWVKNHLRYFLGACRQEAKKQASV